MSTITCTPKFRGCYWKAVVVVDIQHNRSGVATNEAYYWVADAKDCSFEGYWQKAVRVTSRGRTSDSAITHLKANTCRRLELDKGFVEKDEARAAKKVYAEFDAEKDCGCASK